MNYHEQFEMQSFLLSLLSATIFYGLLSLLQRFLRKLSVIRKIGIPLNLMFLFIGVETFLWIYLKMIHYYVEQSVKGLMIFFIVYVGIRLLDLLVMDFLVVLKKKTPVPVVLRDIGRWILSLVALVIVLKWVFPNVNLNIFAVSSIVVGYIVGNATQDTLGNLIAGVALNTERPFEIGHWVTIAGQTGIVVDMTWRATRLRTMGNDYVVIPNASIAKESIVNYSAPTRLHARVISVGVPYSCPPTMVKDVVRRALSEVDGIVKEPGPVIRLVQYADFSINYDIKFFIEDFSKYPDIQSQAMSLIWYHFNRAGIVIPFPIRDVNLREVSAETENRQRKAEIEEIVKTICRIDIFQPLSKEEVWKLSSNLRKEIYGKGEVLVRQGEEGDTFYIIRNGKVAISVSDNSGISTVVAHLGRGAFFGEMSLLTGEKRSATIIAEEDTTVLALSKSIFAEILESNAKIAEELSRVLERRQRENLEKMMKTKELSQEKLQETSQETILKKIKGFFGLK